MNRRVMYVVIALGFGGAEVQVVELAHQMKKRGWDPLIVGLSPPQGLEERADALGVPHTHLGLPFRSKSPRLLKRLITEIRRFQPAVLHTHTLPPNFLGRAARPLCKVPVMITSAHNVWEGGRRKMAFYRLTDRFTDLTTNVSPAAVERYVEIKAVPSASRIRHMPNGIDLTRFRPDAEVRASKRRELELDDDTFLWLAVGAHTPQKDYPNMLAAVTRAEASAPGRWQVLIVGDGPLMDETEARIRTLGLSDRVRVAGKRTDVADLMRAADGYLMSSAWEGLPIVLLESAASGLPMVATDVGGNTQIIEDGSTGFVVPPSDDEALSLAMTKLMSLDPEARASMGAAARAHAARTYSMEAVADRWQDLYMSLLEA